MIGQHHPIDSHRPVVAHQQRDVSYRMVFALAGSAEVGNAVPPLCQAVARCLGQVVVFLLIDLYQPLPIRFRYRIAVSHDHLCLRHVSDGPVAGHHMSSFLQDGKGNGVRGELAVGNNDSIKLFHTS